MRFYYGRVGGVWARERGGTGKVKPSAGSGQQPTTAGLASISSRPAKSPGVATRISVPSGGDHGFGAEDGAWSRSRVHAPILYQPQLRQLPCQQAS